MKKRLQYLFYIIFAAISTLLNIGIQKGMELFFTHFTGFGLYDKYFFNFSYGLLLQMGIATIAAFVFKYFVDKLIIFKDTTSYISKEHFKQVFLYGFFAIFTTILFWGTELCFEKLFTFDNAEYLGAVVGLAAGYTIKFLLDRKYVFRNNA